MSAAEILFEQRGRVGLITLNRPKALNALTHNMCVSMRERLDAWAEDDTVTTVVVRGEGDRAFCAGGDIRSLYESGKAGTPYASAFYRDEYILNTAIEHYPKPYVALIGGIVMGGGVGISVHGRYRISNESTTFAMPETGIGLFPDVGGSYFLSRCPGGIGMYLALTSTRLRAADAVYAGVATHYVPLANWGALLGKLEQGQHPATALLGMAENLSAAPLAALRTAIDRSFSLGTVEEVLASLETDASDWAQQTIETISTKSPTSVKLAFRQLREGAKLGFDDCMRMEFRMVSRIIEGHDFYEGVRAVIIDKDNAPMWRPDNLSAVTDADIDKYFAPLENELPL
jgi:enoyl-CoA hydratase